MTSIGDLPEELLLEIFSYLSRTERIACSMVCTAWMNLMDTPGLWKNLNVRLDSDLLERGTMLATRTYSRHVDSMELCWQQPRPSLRWNQYHVRELSKKTFRYLHVLKYCGLKLKELKLTDWYEFPKYKKALYHLGKFMKSQCELEKLTISRTNFCKSECIKLLSSCSSYNNIKVLNLTYCHHSGLASFGSETFQSSIERIPNLRCFKLDYTTLTSGVMEGLIAGGSVDLCRLDVTVRRHDRIHRIVDNTHWIALVNHCPNLRVDLHIYNLSHYSDLDGLLKSAIPLRTFSLTCGPTWDNNTSREYRRTLKRLIEYKKTLECLKINTSFNREVLDDLLVAMVDKCTLLRCFSFEGIVADANFLKDMCVRLLRSFEPVFRYFHFYPKSSRTKTRAAFDDIYFTYAEAINSRDVDFMVHRSKSFPDLFV